MPSRILAAARGMAGHFWPAVPSADALLVPEAPAADFTAYLESLGVPPPRFVTAFDPAAEFTPFGWNEEAIRLNGSRPRPAEHPPADAVRRVNARTFSLELERAARDPVAETAAFCATPAAVRAWIARAPAGRYVAKGNHGHAGIGQMRFGIGADAAPAPVAALCRLAIRHGGVVFEPLLDVTAEWGALFDLRRDGTYAPPRRHRLLAGPTGGFAGALVTGAGAEDPDWAPHAAAADDAVRDAAAALHRAGYFGPVGLDLLAHRFRGVTRLRPLCDLNARRSMASPAHGLAARFPDRAVLIRHYPAGTLRVPAGYPELRALCDTLSFDSRARQGMIWISPLLSFSRASLAFVGRDADDALAMQRDFLSRCIP